MITYINIILWKQQLVRWYLKDMLELFYFDFSKNIRKECLELCFYYVYMFTVVWHSRSVINIFLPYKNMPIPFHMTIEQRRSRADLSMVEATAQQFSVSFLTKYKMKRTTFLSPSRALSGIPRKRKWSHTGDDLNLEHSALCPQFPHLPSFPQLCLPPLVASLPQCLCF